MQNDNIYQIIIVSIERLSKFYFFSATLSVMPPIALSLPLSVGFRQITALIPYASAGKALDTRKDDKTLPEAQQLTSTRTK